ncbi:MAG: hypothetical protein NXI15_17690 [Gammaproteobacteria bacterium]|nr:hypothetical protein [Gammaproteobacteria bacterium]
MNSELELLEEPVLAFGYGQVSPYSKDGLTLYGPPTESGQPKEIRYGVVATQGGLDIFKRWLKRVSGVIPSDNPEKAHFNYWPGFSAVFGAEWPAKPIVEYLIDADQLSKSIRQSDRHHAIYETASLFTDPISRHNMEEERQPDFWLVIVSDEVYQYGRPNSSVPKDLQESSGQTLGKKAARSFIAHGSLFDELVDESEVYRYDLDFHAQLKARLLGKAVIQIARESTLNNGLIPSTERTVERAMEGPAHTAWNLCTTAYFKAQGSPWRLSGVREGVCYIGLVFKVDDTSATAQNVCCGAQMFLDSGDGVVFRGAMGPWASADEKEFHLSADAAQDLMKTVVEAYENKHGNPPKEIFIHGRNNFNRSEWDGFCEAVPETTNLTGVKIRKTNRLKVYRAATRPLVRGTYWVVNERKAYLWSSGYIPRLATYPGWEVPNPLEIEIQKGEADIRIVVSDILGLTKLNYNACVYGDSNPVTLKFANMVGDILTASPNKNHPPLPFKYYI